MQMKSEYHFKCVNISIAVGLQSNSSTIHVISITAIIINYGIFCLFMLKSALEVSVHSVPDREKVVIHKR